MHFIMNPIRLRALLTSLSSIANRTTYNTGHHTNLRALSTTPILSRRLQEVTSNVSVLVGEYAGEIPREALHPAIDAGFVDAFADFYTDVVGEDEAIVQENVNEQVLASQRSEELVKPLIEELVASGQTDTGLEEIMEMKKLPRAVREHLRVRFRVAQDQADQPVNASENAPENREFTAGKDDSKYARILPNEREMPSSQPIGPSQQQQQQHGAQNGNIGQRR